jgi:RNA polymerase sigma-70 factor (ECF subfamily)
MDATAFKNLVLPLTDKLLHFAYTLLQDPVEAEDAVQEVMLKLWKIRQTLEQFNSLEAYAMKVMKNWCLDRLKSKKPLLVENYNNMNNWRENPDPQVILEGVEKQRLLRIVIENLPLQQKLILQMRDLEGMEFEEISEIMDMEINTVRVNLSRARNKMKNELLKYEKAWIPAR